MRTGLMRIVQNSKHSNNGTQERGHGENSCVHSNLEFSTAKVSK